MQLQLLAIQKCISDSSPYVRKCAAVALTKIFNSDLNGDQTAQLLSLLEKLLEDSSTMVLGSALSAFNEICPQNYDLIHKCYRKLCHLIAGKLTSLCSYVGSSGPVDSP